MNATTITRATVRTFGNGPTNTRNDNTLDTLFAPIFGGFMCGKDRAALSRLFRPITSPLMRLCAVLAYAAHVIAEPFLSFRSNLRANRETVATFKARRTQLITPREILPFVPRAYEEEKQPATSTVKAKKTSGTKKAKPTKKTATVKGSKKTTAKKTAAKKTSKKATVLDLYGAWDYADLQWLAKEWGVKANGKREELVARLVEQGKRRIEEARRVKKTA